MRRQTVDIIGDLVGALVVSFLIDDAIDNGNGTFTLETKCTWWLSIRDKVLIDGKNYSITAFDINKSITIKPLDGGLLPSVDSFSLPAPEYKHGTVKMTQNEVDAVDNKEELVPFVYLFEVITDRKNTDDESMIDRETDLRIFFLNSANTADWLTDDHYENVIDPMQQMVDLFIKNVKASKLFADEIDYNCIPLSNFSEEGEQENSIFDCNLSGIELKLFAKLRKDLSCSNKCKC